MRCTEDLETEHGAVLRALDVLDRATEPLEAGKPIDAGDVDEVLTFMSEFVDGCHHAKEERILFPAMVAAGAPKEGGPVGLMIEQHQAGRRHIRAMREASEGYRRGEANAAEALLDAAQAYGELLRRHLRYENTVVFPMADAMLPSHKRQEIVRAYESLERDVVGEGRHEQFHALLSRLQERYPAPVKP